MWYNDGMRYKTSFTISQIAKKLLALLAVRYGLSRTAMLELLIREAARAEGIGSDELVKVEWKDKPDES